MILSNMTSGGTWKSKTKYCGEEGKYQAAVFFVYLANIAATVQQKAKRSSAKGYTGRKLKKTRKSKEAGIDYGDDTDDDCQQLLSLVQQRESD